MDILKRIAGGLLERGEKAAQVAKEPIFLSTILPAAGTHGLPEDEYELRRLWDQQFPPQKKRMKPHEDSEFVEFWGDKLFAAVKSHLSDEEATDIRHELYFVLKATLKAAESHDRKKERPF
jgi:hypothetical protein